MINEANDHPRYAVDVQRDQSKPGHPRATVVDITIHRPREKASPARKKDEGRFFAEGLSGSEFRQNSQQEVACGFFVAVVNLRCGLKGKPLL